MQKRGVLYTTPQGFEVRKFSHSQASEYFDSPAKFKWKRLHGWRERVQHAAMKFGIDIQESVRRFYKEGENPADAFSALWQSRKEEKLDYGNESWEIFDEQGKGLMRQLARDAHKYPIARPVFLDFKDSVLPKIEDPATGVIYQSIPDVIDSGPRGDFVCDIKAMGKDVDSRTPGLIIMDPQLRTQAATTKIFRVALWVFNRKPKAAQPVTADAILAASRKALASRAGLDALAQYVAREVNHLSIDDAGKLLGQPEPKAVSKDWLRLKKEDAAIEIAAKEAIASLTAEPEYSIEWHEGVMTESHAMEAVRDQMAVVPQIQAGWFPCRCGMRWPNDAAPRCPFRGLCMEERAEDATDEQREAWRKITAENLVRWDESAFMGI